LVTSGSEGRSLGYNNGQKLVFASDGVGHVVWSGGGATGTVNCNRYDPGTGWASDFQLSPTADYPNPAVALDADGTTIHVVWDDAGLRYRKCTRRQDGSDDWGQIELPYNARAIEAPAVACVPGDPNHIVACWFERYQAPKRGSSYEAVGVIERVNGVWGTPIRLDSSSTDSRRYASIAAGPNGDVYIAYYNSANHIFVKTRHNGAWGAAVDVTSGLGSDQCCFPAIEVNPYTGNPHAVFAWMRITKISKRVSDTTHAVYHTYRNSQGAWQTPGPVSEPIHGQGAYGVWFVYAPRVAFAGTGAAHAVWCTRFPFRYGIVGYSYLAGEGGSWTAPVWLTTDTSSSSEFPKVTVDENAQTVHVVWSRMYGLVSGTEIWWRSNYLGGGGGMGRPVALSQSGIELFPNPAKSGRVTVQYALPHAGPLTVTLLDVSGRAVKTQEVAATSRSGSFSIDARGLKAGVYVMKLESGTTSLTRKLVVH